MSGPGAPGWPNDPVRRAEFHAWLRDVNKTHAVNLTYEGVKARLGVQHLAEYPWCYAYAQRTILEWVKEIKTRAGSPEQLTLPI